MSSDVLCAYLPMFPRASWSLGNDRSLTDEISVLAAVHAELRHHIPHSVQVRR